MTKSEARAQKQTRVLIVDDSAAARAALKTIVSTDPALRVMATAADPFIAAQKMRDEMPDVILLDLELPRMDGLTFLRRIMAQRPIPVVVCSSHTDAGSVATMKALEIGAAEVIGKPALGDASQLQEASMRICDAIRAAAQTRRKAAAPGGNRGPGPKLTADEILPPPRRGAAPPPRTEPIVCLGASTGGTEALLHVLRSLPADTPPIVIVQHMPEKFTAAFARRLDTLCRINVREAQHGDPVRRGQALIAPGNHHMLLRRSAQAYRVTVVDGPSVSRHRPSVDVLFRSAAQAAGGNALGMLMTGMGDDGAQGMLEMREAGAMTIAQDEASCVVYGMPRAAVARGGVVRSLALDSFAEEMLAWARKHGLAQA